MLFKDNELKLINLVSDTTIVFLFKINRITFLRIFIMDLMSRKNSNYFTFHSVKIQNISVFTEELVKILQK